MTASESSPLSSTGNVLRHAHHPLSTPLRSLHLASIPGRTAIALSSDADAVELAFIDDHGKTIERPHACLRSSHAPLNDPQVVWKRTDFLVTARNGRGELEMRFARGGAPLLSQPIAHVEGKFALAFFLEQLHVATVTNRELGWWTVAPTAKRIAQPSRSTPPICRGSRAYVTRASPHAAG